MEPLSRLVVSDMVEAGYDEKSVFTNVNNVAIPGWFRPRKEWDIAAYEDGVLVAALELKSMSKDFGNNFNNRAEEALGSAEDINYSVRNHVIDLNVLPPGLGYAMVIVDNPDSRKVSNGKLKPGTKQVIDYRYPLRGEFRDTDYIHKYAVMGRRLLLERIYQAVWIVAVEPSSGRVYEPDPLLTYSRFIRTIGSWIHIIRA